MCWLHFAHHICGELKGCPSCLEPFKPADTSFPFCRWRSIPRAHRQAHPHLHAGCHKTKIYPHGGYHALKTKHIIFKHALRNSLIPVITYLGPLTAGIITGSFVVETTFSIPGLGKYFISSILNRDYPIIMGTTAVLAALIIFMNLLVDVAYKVVDPRITIIGKGE